MNIKLEAWDVSNLDLTDNVMIRVSHDQPNGSAITSSGATFVEALQNLAITIQKTKLADEFWKTPLINQPNL